MALITALFTAFASQPDVRATHNNRGYLRKNQARLLANHKTHYILTSCSRIIKRRTNVPLAVVVGYSGIKGDQGDPGLTGLDGMHGPKGDMGDMGPIGPAGMKGDTGYPGPPGLYGEKGEQGMKGYAGPPGIQGDAGMPGLTGMTGQKGDTGMPGYDGPKGEPGPKGDKGEPGEGSSGQGSAGNAPIVYVSPRTRLVFEGTPVTFNCYATGQPAPTIMWERVGKGQVPQGSSGALTIAKAQSWHSGQYRCRAFNMHGMKEATVELQVEGNYM